MSIYQESGFRFDFNAAARATIHDKAEPHDGNRFWPGVDFRVIVGEGELEIWIEVKNWNSMRFRGTESRASAKRDFKRTLVPDVRKEILAKFLGTTSYLTWSGLGVPRRVVFVVFLEPPDRGRHPLISTFQDRLRDDFKHARACPWGNRIEYCVVDLTQFRQKYPEYPVARASPE